MSNFLQFTVFGIMLGAGYAIAATGLVVTYTTSGVFNFAQGAVGMIAAFGYWELVSAHHQPTLVALLIVLILGASIAGAFVERVLMRRLHGASAERPVMVTLGLMVILTGMATVIWSPTVQRSVDPQINGQFRLVGINIQNQYVLIIGVAIAVAVGLRILFRTTRTGYALRAVVDDPELLAMSGVSPNRMSQYGWILGFFMAALSGVLLAPTQTTGISIESFTLLVVSGYAAAIVGRLKNIPVTFLAALAIGLAENYILNYVEPHLSSQLQTDVTSALPMVFLFIALVTLPSVRLRAVGRLTSMRAPRVAGGRESLIGGVVFLVIAVVVGFAFADTYFNGTTLGQLGGMVMCLAIVGLSLVLVTGYSGQVSLCQFSFMGIGAFVMGKVAGGGSVARPAGRHRHLCRDRCARRPTHHPPQRPLPGARHLRVRRRRGPGVLRRRPRLRRRRTVRSYRIMLPGLSFGGNTAEFLLVTVFFVLSALAGAGHPPQPVRSPTGGRQRLPGRLRHRRPQHRLHQGGRVRHRRRHGRHGRRPLRHRPGDRGHHRLRHLPRHHLRALRHHLEHPHRVGRVPRRASPTWPSTRSGPAASGIFAGIGIILIGRAANGILGIDALHVRLPWAKSGGGAGDQVTPAFSGMALGGEGSRAAG